MKCSDIGSLALPDHCSQGYLLVTVWYQAAMWFGFDQVRRRLMAATTAWAGRSIRGSMVDVRPRMGSRGAQGEVMQEGRPSSAAAGKQGVHATRQKPLLFLNSLFL